MDFILNVETYEQKICGKLLYSINFCLLRLKEICNGLDFVYTTCNRLNEILDCISQLQMMEWKDQIFICIRVNERNSRTCNWQ